MILFFRKRSLNPLLTSLVSVELLDLMVMFFSSTKHILRSEGERAKTGSIHKAFFKLYLYRIICYIQNTIVLCEKYSWVSSGSSKPVMVQVLSEWRDHALKPMLNTQRRPVWRTLSKLLVNGLLYICLIKHFVMPFVCFKTFAFVKVVCFCCNVTEFNIYA